MKKVFSILVCWLLLSTLEGQNILNSTNNKSDTCISNIQQNDANVCVGTSLMFSVNLPPDTSFVIVPPGSEYEYIFKPPPAGWMNTTGGWPLGIAPFGNEANGTPPEFNYRTYWPSDDKDDYDLFVRKTITLPGFNLSNVHWHIGVDNGFVLYVNGFAVDSASLDGYASRWEYNGTFPAAFLRPGDNIIAVALTDNGGLTAFDMMIDYTGPPPGLKIRWSTGDTTQKITVTPSQTTVYNVTISNGPLVCQDSVKVAVNFPVVKNIAISICNGESYAGYSTNGVFIDTLVSSEGCDSVRILNLTILNKSFSTITDTICQGGNYAGYSSSGIYVDTLVAANGCDSIRTLKLTVLPRSYSTINQTVCYGQNYLGYSSSGTYLDTLVASNGCDSIRRINLLVLPKLAPFLGNDTILCTADSLDLYPGIFNTYSWQDGSTLSHYIVRQPGFYSVTVSDSCGFAQSTILVKGNTCDAYFPNAFTPNNDGKNDQFKVLNARNIKDYYMVVYNRWGEKVFETNDFKKGWNGNYKGQLQETGLYVWLCEYNKSTNPTKIKVRGTVLLMK